MRHDVRSQLGERLGTQAFAMWQHLPGASDAYEDSLLLLDKVFERAPFGYARLCPQGRTRWANPVLFTLLRGTATRKEEWFDRPGIELMAKADRLVFEGALGRALRTSRPQTVLLRGHRSDGDTLWACRGTIMPIGGGHVVAVLFDLPLAREAERNRRELEDSLARLIEVLPEGVVVHRGGQVLYANQAARDLLESGRERIEDCPFIRWFPVEDQPERLRRWRSVELGTGKAQPPEEFLLHAADGKPRPVELTDTRLSLGGHSAVATSLRNLERERSLRRQLLQADRLATMGVLAAGVAHEINSPLTFAVNHLELVQQSIGTLRAALAEHAPTRALEPEIGRVLDLGREALESLRGIGRLIGDLRSASNFREEATNVDVAGLVEIAITLASAALKQANAEVLTELAPDLHVRGNRGQLLQVLTNLLANAAHALEGARDPRELRVRSHLADGFVHVDVEDTGPGIAAEHMSRVFDAFYTTKSPERGTGLGLAISRTIVEDHAGTLVLSSALGQGTRATIRLPLGPSEVRAPQTAPHVAAPVQPRRILLVDDDESLLQLLALRLRARHEVATAATIAAAVDALKQHRIDVVVADVQMHGESGLDLYAWIQEHRAGLTSAFLFMTGGAFEPDLQTALIQTGRPCLYKPFGTAELEQAIEAM